MSKNNKNEKKIIVKRWFITLSLFFSGQFVFLLIDGTFLEPKLNKMGNFMKDVCGEKLEWFTIYHNPFLKFVTLLFIIHMIYMLIKDIIISLRSRHSSEVL